MKAETSVVWESTAKAMGDDFPAPGVVKEPAETVAGEVRPGRLRPLHPLLIEGDRYLEAPKVFDDGFREDLPIA